MTPFSIAYLMLLLWSESRCPSKIFYMKTKILVLRNFHFMNTIFGLRLFKQVMPSSGHRSNLCIGQYTHAYAGNSAIPYYHGTGHQELETTNYMVTPEFTRLQQ